MDIKINGLPTDVMARAMQQAREARLHILGIMTSALPGYREQLSPYAPQHEEVTVNPEIIRMINRPRRQETSRPLPRLPALPSTLTISGRISIFAPTAESMRQAKEMVMYLRSSMPSWARTTTPRFAAFSISAPLLKFCPIWKHWYIFPSLIPSVWEKDRRCGPSGRRYAGQGN